MKYFPKLNNSQLKEFQKVFYENYDDFYEHNWADESDYTREFDMLNESNKDFINFVSAFNKFNLDYVGSDRKPRHSSKRVSILDTTNKNIPTIFQ